MTQNELSFSTQGKLLARHLKATYGVALSHTQALETLAALNNEKSFNVMQSKKPKKQTAAEGSAKDLLGQAIAKGLTVSEALSAFSTRQTPQELTYVELAAMEQADGQLEFDDNAVSSISEEGCYVQGWYWIPRSAAHYSLAASFILEGAPHVEIDGVELDYDATETDEAGLLTALKERPASAEWLVRFLKDGQVVFELTPSDFENISWRTEPEQFEGTVGGAEITLDFSEGLED